MATHYQPIAAAHWTEGAAMMSCHPGFGIGDLATAFLKAFKGKRGNKVSKLQSLRDSNPDCPLNVKTVACILRLDIDAAKAVAKALEEGTLK